TAHMQRVVSAFVAAYGSRFTLAHDGSTFEPGRDRGAGLGAALYAMNADAAFQQYHARPDAPAFRCHLLAPMTGAGLAGLVKAVHFFAHVCDVPPVPEAWKVYQDLQGVACELSRRLVTSLPEYIEAPWHWTGVADGSRFRLG